MNLPAQLTQGLIVLPSSYKMKAAERLRENEMLKSDLALAISTRADALALWDDIVTLLDLCYSTAQEVENYLDVGGLTVPRPLETDTAPDRQMYSRACLGSLMKATAVLLHSHQMLSSELRDIHIAALSKPVPSIGVASLDEHVALINRHEETDDRYTSLPVPEGSLPAPPARSKEKHSFVRPKKPLASERGGNDRPTSSSFPGMM